VDFNQILPLGKKQALSDQAMRAWVEKNPGPATGLLEQFRPVSTSIPVTTQRPWKGFCES
jgi:hypothetical protein